MDRLALGLVVGVVCAVVLAGCANGTDDGGGSPELLSERARAVQAGRAFLLARQRGDGSWAPAPMGFPGGSTAMATWALLESDGEPNDPAVAKALAWLRALETDKTYTLSVRANAYRAAAAEGAGAFGDPLQRDVRRLFANSMDGAYTYVVEPKVADIADQSNSHYAAMGVEAGAEEGVKVPREFWRQVMRYWLGTQNPDGGWPYSQQGTPSTPTMTAAALATLGLCRRQLGGETGGADAAIERGADWLGARFRESLRESSVTYYYFLTLDRLERLTGRRRLGGRDISETMVAELLRRQKPDGGWEGSWGRDVSTAYAVIVLSRQD